MCFIAEAEPVLALSEKVNESNRIFKITTAKERAFVCLDALQIHINSELGGKILYYRNGLYAYCWLELKKFLDQQGIVLPAEKVPCHKCDGGQCLILCNRETKQIHQPAVAYAVA